MVTGEVLGGKRKCHVPEIEIPLDNFVLLWNPAWFNEGYIVLCLFLDL